MPYLKVFLLFLCITVFSAFTPANDYQQHYGEDYQRALAFCELNKQSIKRISKAYGCPEQELMSIVFPELIRFNSFQNFFETGALELGYVEAGTELVDFSIGHFQMKPSFAETLEKLVENSNQAAWAADFELLCSFDAGTIEQQRKERIQRLKTTEWQLKYLCCFYRYLDEVKYPKRSAKERIITFSSVYNCGLNADPSTLEYWQKHPSFPYGTAYKGPQHIYAHVAYDFYKKHSPKLF